MKILIVSNYQPPHMGGIEFAAQALKHCWERDGHKVTWMTTDIPQGGRPSTPDNIRIKAANFAEDWWQINTPFVSPFSLRQIRQKIIEHDVINVHSLAPGLSTVVLSTAIRMGKPVVTTQHVGVIPLSSRVITGIQHKVICSTARWATKHGVPLTFVGEAVRSWFIEQARIPADMTYMTPAGIDPEAYYFVTDAEQNSYMQKWKLPGNQFKVLFVGRYYEKKGLHLIKDLAEKCPDILFSFRGNGPIDPARWNLPNVRIIPFVNDKELRELYGCHNLFIMPSVGEGWPAVIPQAMACGLGCMISEETFEGYQRDPDKFIVVPRDTDEIVKHLNEAKEEKIPILKERRELSDYSIRTWNWMNTARIYTKLFEQQIEKSTKV